MTNYQELKRLAEDCKEREIDFDDVSPQQGSTSCDKLVRHYLAAASPDVVLGLIKELEHTKMAANSEAQEVDERNAVIAKLCAQNQALTKRLEDADYLIRAFENGCNANDYARDIDDYRTDTNET